MREYTKIMIIISYVMKVTTVSHIYLIISPVQIFKPRFKYLNRVGILKKIKIIKKNIFLYY